MTRLELNKKCRACTSIKRKTHFYKDKSRKDGYMYECKLCVSKRNKITHNTEESRAWYRKYNKIYRSLPVPAEKMKASNKKYRSTEKGKAARRKHVIKWRLKNAEKVLVHNIVTAAIRTGKLKSKPCVVCGDKKSQAHHEDYDKPLNVIWLCSKHHCEVHRV